MSKPHASSAELTRHDNFCWHQVLISPLTVSLRQKNLNKGELALKHAVGLGQQPNVIPAGKPVFNGPCRAVEVGWHPVGGVAGKWFAEETGLGKMITEKINKYPDPTQHWAVLVGDYAHQLWMVSGRPERTRMV